MTEHRGSTILVCGISGVGKTATLERVSTEIPGSATWSAGEIIGEARNLRDPELLRKLSADELQRSQELLVRGFEKRRKAFPELLVLLDAHSVIDTDAGLVDVSVDVVRGLEPSGIVHLVDDVSRILERRINDKQRVRPIRSIQQLKRYQDRSIARCELYSATLKVPLVKAAIGDTRNLVRAIRELGIAR